MNRTNSKNNKRKRVLSHTDKFISTFNISTKKAKKTLNKLDKANLEIIDKDQINKLDIIVNSESSKKKYKVTLDVNKNGIRLCCNCGERFGIPKRYNCKHISSVLFSQFNFYINSFSDVKPDKIMDKLEDLFKSFNIK